jgi:hypothetical protein
MVGDLPGGEGGEVVALALDGHEGNAGRMSNSSDSHEDKA